MYREQWLNLILPHCRRHFQAAGYTVPDNVRLTCGWPSKMAMGRAKRRIGECWSTECSDDQIFEISVSPVLDDPVRVVGVLIHELVHATVGLAAGHRKPFGDCARKVGLVAPWTATTETPELEEQIKQWVKKVGAYPHARLDAPPHRGGTIHQDAARMRRLRLQSADHGQVAGRLRATLGLPVRRDDGKLGALICMFVNRVV